MLELGFQSQDTDYAAASFLLHQITIHVTVSSNTVFPVGGFSSISETADLLKTAYVSILALGWDLRGLPMNSAKT